MPWLDSNNILMFLVAMVFLSLVRLVRFFWRRPTRKINWQAEEKAIGLLGEFLTRKDIADLKRCRHLLVPSRIFSRRIYAIPSRPGFVKVIENGWWVSDLCLQPTEPVPRGDWVLIQFLMLWGAERQYLQTARSYPVEEELYFPRFRIKKGGI